MATDPVPLLQSLIRCPSVTPAEGGALEFVAATLKARGFETHRLRFQEPGTAEVDNLFARYGSGKPHFCFAGHTDVVPAGEATSWRHPHRRQISMTSCMSATPAPRPPYS